MARSVPSPRPTRNARWEPLVTLVHRTSGGESEATCVAFLTRSVAGAPHRRLASPPLPRSRPRKPMPSIRSLALPAAKAAIPPAFAGLALMLSLGFAGAARAQGPTLATEDTMHTDVSTVLVKAPRVT